MGLARIVSNRGEGLYTATPLYDTTALDRELTALETAAAAYATLILRALETQNLLNDAVAAARAAVEAIIQQWLDDLIAAGREEPAPLVPATENDPETGLPWADPDRAQEQPLVDAINAVRSAASVATVTRNDDLDDACLAYLREQVVTLAMGHIGKAGSTPANRANAAGYANPETLHELLHYGATTPAKAVTAWQRQTSAAAWLIDADVTNIGVAHVYARTHAGSYLWAVLLASDERTAIVSEILPDPAKVAADEAENGLVKIEAPKTDLSVPDKLASAVRTLATAGEKLKRAEAEVTRLMAEKLERDARIAQLTALKTTLNAQVLDVWACFYVYDLPVGSTIYTAEVPGHWLDDATLHMDTFDGQTVSYYERSWNIVRLNTQSGGKLRMAETMKPAAVFYNAAIEPGHEKWKPKWRYGTITKLAGSVCDLTLAAVPARRLQGESMEVDPVKTLAGVYINYPPCFGETFQVGDEVLVHFVDQDSTKPEVIGYRRWPRGCGPKRISWEQIQ